MKATLVLTAVIGGGLLQTQDNLPERTKGRADAPVTVYEMADFQCPACRLFTITVFPMLDTEYVATGKVRWVFINMPLTSVHPNAVAAAEVAMCSARQGRFWPTHDRLYQHQAEWANLPSPRPALIALAQQAGADRDKLLTCLKNSRVRRAVEKDAALARRTGARSTPSFYIEGGLIEGAPYTPDPLRYLLDSLYAARTGRSAKRE